MKNISFCLIAWALVAATGTVHAENYCGPLTSHYGPYDFRDRASGKLEIVENAHFTPGVENGTRGNTGSVGGDLSYTLGSIPNHHRALAAIGTISIREKSVQLSGARYPTECYFERAIRFAPNDGVVHAAYGNYLNALGKRDKALTMFKYAVELEPNNATFNYNLGLLYLKANDFDKASEYADKAYSLGFPLPGLKNQLAAARKAAPSGK
jgi:hypothetical protein